MSAPPVIIARGGLAVINPFYLPRIHEVTAPDPPIIDLATHACALCLRPLDEVRAVGTCPVTDTDGKPWSIVVCEDCRALIDASEHRKAVAVAKKGRKHGSSNPHQASR
ncbi:MAG: hypothetical protein WAN23_06205 [Candidatus Acidiferrales bacterium]